MGCVCVQGCAHRCVSCCRDCDLRDGRARLVGDCWLLDTEHRIVFLASRASSPLSTPGGLREGVSIAFQGSQVVQTGDSQYPCIWNSSSSLTVAHKARGITWPVPTTSGWSSLPVASLAHNLLLQEALPGAASLPALPLWAHHPLGTGSLSPQGSALLRRSGPRLSWCHCHVPSTRCQVLSRYSGHIFFFFLLNESSWVPHLCIQTPTETYPGPSVPLLSR